MKKKITMSILCLLLLISSGCGKTKETETPEIVKSLHSKLETYFIPKIYDSFDSYSNNNFYMDKTIKYEDLSDESKLYYAYNTIENKNRRWFTSCSELKDYTFKNEDISLTCNKNKEIIQKDQSGFEWLFNDVNKAKLETAYKEMYGKDKELPLKTFTMDYTGICLYSQVKNDFLCFKQTGGDETTGHAETKFDHYEETKNTIEIYDRYLWIVDNNDTVEYYKSRFNTSEKLDIKTKDFSKGALYKHTFKKDNNTYYWYSSERID